MTTKRWLLVAVGLVAIIIVIYYAYNRNGTNVERDAYTSGEKVVEYSPSGGPLRVLNETTGQFETVSDLSVEPNNEIERISFSPNGDSYLYSSLYDYPKDQILDADDNVEARSVYLSGDSKPIINNAHGSAWLSNDKLIYQDIKSLEVVTYSATRREELSRHNFDLENIVELHPLDENTAIALPISYDVSEVTSQIIYLDTLQTKNYISGLGLEVKTILDTDLIAYQVFDAEGNSQTAVSNWKTRNTVRTTDIYANALIWDKTGKLKYWDYETDTLIDLTDN